MIASGSTPFAYTTFGGLNPYTDTTGRTSVPATIDPQERTFIAIIEGQSMASNLHSAEYTMLHSDVVHSSNWAGNRLLYEHEEPMFGGTFRSAGELPENEWDEPYISIWGGVGDQLIERDLFDRVIWMNVSASGLSSTHLAPGGEFGTRLPMAFHLLNRMAIRGYQVSAILSMQGEQDTNDATSKATYKANRLATFKSARAYGFSGKVIIPLESWVNGTTSNNVRNGQSELVSENSTNFVLGPDFDTLGLSNRDFFGTHFNATGHAAAIEMWADTLEGIYG